MKKLSVLFPALLVAVCCGMVLCGCSIGGLDWQKDYNRKPDTLDAHLYKNAWEYLKQRSIQANPDTIFKRMYDGIIYSGIDTNEYTQPGRTYIFLHNDAIYNKKTPTDGFFGRVADSLGKTGGISWTTYKRSAVKSYLQYLIMQGEYSHYTLPTYNVTVTTLAPAGVYAGSNNPNSVMNLKVLNASNSNTQDDPVTLNDSVFVRTSDLHATNGMIHVIDKYLTTALPK